MIGTCSKCGNHKWDKVVDNGKVYCPECNNSWDYVALPLLILSGCSGIGKTTTAIEIVKKKVDFVVLDADIFGGIQNAVSQEDYQKRVDTICWLSRNINQSGKPVLWTVAGNLDMFPQSYNSRFFSEIDCLALVSSEETIRKHMTEGRGITDEGWVAGSVGYNEYFKSHDSIGDLKFETLDIDSKTPSEVADQVISWVEKCLNKNTVG